MKKNDCLFSDIQNLCNAASYWLIKNKTKNDPIKTNETISCACCHISAWWQRNQLNLLFDRNPSEVQCICVPANDVSGIFITYLLCRFVNKRPVNNSKKVTERAWIWIVYWRCVFITVRDWDKLSASLLSYAENAMILSKHLPPWRGLVTCPLTCVS